MEATDKEKLLAKHLDVYIKDRHTQEECIGFIDGFKEALKQWQSLPLVEDKIFDIVTDLIRDDISKEEAIDKLLDLYVDGK